MTKSLWVRFRDYAENIFYVVENSVLPIAADIIVNAGRAVLSAASNGVDINSHEMAKVALNSIHEQVPGIEARLSLVAAGMAIHNAAVPEQAPPPPENVGVTSGL